jgi:hypothetical protein
MSAFRPALAFAVLVAITHLSFASPANALLAERITTATVTLPAPLENGPFVFYQYSQFPGGPRLHHAGMADGRTMVGWTDAIGNGHVSLVHGAALDTTFNFAARLVRGLVVHEDGSFAVLLLDRGAIAGNTDDVMRLSKRNADGSEVWTVPLTGGGWAPSDVACDGRLAYGAGKYGANFGVYGYAPASVQGQDGETFRYVSDAGVVTTGWEWGTAHCMSNVVGFHPETSLFSVVAGSDCYPSKGLIANRTTSIFASDGSCTGLVSAVTGEMAPAAGALWLAAMAAFDRPGFPGKGIGIVRMRSNASLGTVWLTNTNGTTERDPILARIGSNLGSNRFLVGWRLATPADSLARVAVIDSMGAILEGPEVLPASLRWVHKDDSFRTRPEGTISWVEGVAGGSTLRLSTYVDPTLLAVPTLPSSGTALGSLAALPNPAPGGAARVRFRLGNPSLVTVTVFDAVGRRVRVLLSGERASGPHELVWDGRDTKGRFARPGVYFVRVETAVASASVKLLVARR